MVCSNYVVSCGIIKKINLNQTLKFKISYIMWKYKDVIYKDKKEMREKLKMTRCKWKGLIKAGKIIWVD